MRTYVSRTPEMTSNYDVYKVDNGKKTLPKQLSYYSKALRYVTSRCVVFEIHVFFRNQKLRNSRPCCTFVSVITIKRLRLTNIMGN